jgi:hypothetical protein
MSTEFLAHRSTYYMVPAIPGLLCCTTCYVFLYLEKFLGRQDLDVAFKFHISHAQKFESHAERAPHQPWHTVPTQKYLPTIDFRAKGALFKQ